MLVRREFTEEEKERIAGLETEDIGLDELQKKVAESARVVAARVGLTEAPEPPKERTTRPRLRFGPKKPTAERKTTQEVPEISPDAPGRDVGSGMSLATGGYKSRAVDTRDFRKSPPVRWAWKGYIPEGTCVGLQGDQGLGKSLMAIDLSSRLISYSPMPNSLGEKTPGIGGKVGILSSEDTYEMIMYRCTEAGLREDQVVVLSAVNAPGGWKFPKDFEDLKKEIILHNIKCLVMDPILGFMEDNFNKTEVMRKFAEELATMASMLGVTVICLNHLNKAKDQSASQRSLGSQALSQVCRAVYVVGLNPEDTETTVLACSKINAAKKPLSLTYRVSERTVLVGGDEYGVGRIDWQDSSNLTADDIINVVATNTKKTFEAKNLASDFVVEFLRSGPKKASELEAAAKEVGISRTTLGRAKQNLEVISYRDENYGKNRITHVRLPGVTSHVPGPR